MLDAITQKTEGTRTGTGAEKRAWVDRKRILGFGNIYLLLFPSIVGFPYISHTCTHDA